MIRNTRARTLPFGPGDVVDAGPMYPAARPRRQEFGVQQLPGSVQILHPAQWNSRSNVRRLAAAPQYGSTRRFGPALAVMHGEGEKKMLWTICLVLLVLWALGMATSYTAGGLIHVLLVVGLIVLVFRVIQGRRILT